MKNKQVLSLLLLVIGPLLGIFLIESIIRGSYGDTLLWITENYKLYLTNSFILLLIQTIFLVIINNVYLALLLNYLFIGIFTFINFYKIEILNSPLLPWDLFLAKQVVDLLPVLINYINIYKFLISLFIIIGIIIVLVKYCRLNYLNWLSRGIILVISVVILLSIVNYNKNFMNKVLLSSGAVHSPYDQIYNQSINGFLVGFILNMPNVMINSPSDYSADATLNYVKSIKKDNDNIVSNIKPNIVIVMSEAFWELNNLNILDKSERSITPTVDKYKMGNFLSPAFGGATANVEFEVLTGLSTSFLPAGSIPYQQYIFESIPAMPNILKSYGYNTTAIHTFNKYYWSRENVYPNLGFEKFIGLEDIENPIYHGVYIDDNQINDYIVDELNQNTNPSFIYAVTMQNHATYLDNRYGENTNVYTDSYSNETNEVINTYGTGIQYSDSALDSLLTQLNQIEEPTLLVFFGDHLPALGNVYSELGYIDNMSDMNLEERLKMKMTPLVVWNNYKDDLPDLDLISASFLAPKIFKWAELKMPLFYNFLEDYSDVLPGYFANLKVDNNGNLLDITPKNMWEYEEMYKMFQYDLLFGEDFSEKTLFK